MGLFTQKYFSWLKFGENIYKVIVKIHDDKNNYTYIELTTKARNKYLAQIICENELKDTIKFTSVSCNRCK